jgi:hypothetical protein
MACRSIVFRFRGLAYYPQGGRKVVAGYPATPFHKTFVTPLESFVPFVKAVLDRVPKSNLHGEFYSDGSPPFLVVMGVMAAHKSVVATCVAAIKARRHFDRQKRNLGGFVAPDSVWMPKTTEQMRRMTHAVATADVVLATRRAGPHPESSSIWESAFPDFGLRDDAMIPVISVRDDSAGYLVEKLEHVRTTSS